MWNVTEVSNGRDPSVNRALRRAWHPNYSGEIVVGEDLLAF